MVIRFACPEGHPLTASEDLIGKAGQCPKCSAKFLVPDPNATDDEPFEAPTTEEKPQPPTPAAKSDDDEIIVFLCPEGHKLNGPRRMQGQAGQCPHCGAKFRIPSYDDEEDDSAELTEPELVEPNVMPTGAMLDHSELDGEITEEVEELSDEIIEVVDDPQESGMHLPISSPLPPPAAGESSLAAIFTSLWRRRSKATQVTVYLEGGEVIEPTRYSPGYSQRDYAVFAVDDEELTFRVTAVPWDAVTRIDFGRVEDLPEGLFE